jgi:PAS domain S-box-containing protein
MTGYAREELFENSLSILYESNDEYEVCRERIYKEMAQKGSSSVETRWRRKDGKLIDVLLNAAPLKLPSPSQGMTFTVMDITERKQAEEALKVSEERFRRLAENARDVIFRFRQQPSLGFDYISQAVLRISGYAPEEFYADPLLIFKVSHPDSRSFLEEITSRPQDYLDKPVVLHWIHKNGETIWTEQRSIPIYDNDGKIIAIEGIIRDVTGRKQMDEALYISEENFRNSLNSSSLGIRIVGEDGNTLYANRAMLDIYGYESIDELNTTRTRERYTPESYGEHVLRREKRLRGEPVPSEYEISIVRKDGTIRHLQVFRKEVLWDGKKQYQVLYNDITEQKHAQEALQISEENYRNSIDSSPMGVVVFDGNEEILYANRAILDLYGFKNIEELRNTPIKERYTPESYTEYLIRNEKFMKGEVSSLGYELSIRRKDGTIRYLQAFRKEIVWDGKKQFQLLYNDITERKQAENEIRESRARFRELARLLPLGIWETDENGIFTYTNEEAMKSYGYTRQDTTPINQLQTMVPQDRDRAARNTQRILQGETLGGTEYTALRKDGSTFPSLVYSSPINRNGKSVGLRGITINTTEQKITEKRLEQAAQEWRATFDSLTDMVCILDNDFRITRVNMAYANMLRKEPQELLGKVCYELINRDCPCHDCPHQKTLQTGKPARAEFFEPALGTYVEVSTSPIFNENRDVKGSVHVMRDISERKQMEQQLMLTDRLASVGELASGVAHELNNPLTSVIGFSQLLMEGEIPDNIKEDLSLINSEAQRAANVVKNLLTFARKHAAIKQSTRINNVIEDVLKLRAYEHKVNNIEVIRKFASDLPEILVDYFQIQQVFLNLIINAEFFMTEAHRRGTLTISIERVDHAVRISFADNGPGIPRENLKRIFDPFFTTKEVGKGTGLGLSICHGIITEHGGKIYAESEVGKGATFVIELPINDH